MPSGKLTSSFIEGRLPDTTFTGDYLTTSFLKGGGIANVEINREVGLDQYDTVQIMVLYMLLMGCYLHL